MIISFIFILAATYTTPSNAQIACSNGIFAGDVTAGPLLIKSVLCSDDDTIHIDIEYTAYNDEWFGIVFSETMIGEALVYTTGKSGVQNQALWSYDNTAKNMNGVNYDSANDWTEVSTDTSNGIRIIYKKALSDTPWTMSTTQIPISYAIGTSLDLGFHSTGYSPNPSDAKLLFSTPGTQSPPTIPITALPTSGASSVDPPSPYPTATLGNIHSFFHYNGHRREIYKQQEDVTSKISSLHLEPWMYLQSLFTLIATMKQ